jgi:WhiB family transcriptional regulator, redox-sensing transcriptional regulator
MTIRTGASGYPRIAGTRTRGPSAPTRTRRDGARLLDPARRRTPGDDMGAWIQQGACTTSPPELFFPASPVGHTRASRRQIDDARAVCRQCPVIEACRNWAMANPLLSQHGVWAGTTEDERRAARRKAERAAQRSRGTVEPRPGAASG